ncbi:histidine triad nucleotide-binding protein 1 [Aphis craccivora]|uniref:Histidine triad nucleotide-binding protein 1 n=1 Tax=Aphis craccivora TaxID=307492 RepID=A0A6G0Y7S1_APHCR|nr:histidine triad nucleotide-binding protein 1 [Aphis craccivora]
MKISSNIIYQDKIVTAFDDINPKAPIHILIVPNCFIKTANDINKKNKNVIAHMFYIAIQIAKEKKISEDGYKIILFTIKNKKKFFKRNRKELGISKDNNFLNASIAMLLARNNNATYYLDSSVVVDNKSLKLKIKLILIYFTIINSRNPAPIILSVEILCLKEGRNPDLKRYSATASIFCVSFI